MAVSSVDLSPLWAVPCEDHDEHFAGAAGDNQDGQVYDLEYVTCVQGVEERRLRYTTSALAKTWIVQLFWKPDKNNSRK